MPYTDKQLLDLVAEGLKNLPYDRKPAGLYDPIKYVLSLGGKRLRPVLMLIAYNIYKEDPERILTPALGLETYHNFTLLHDDVMDRADMRRGRPTVHRVWDDNTAILSGDNMLVLAYQRMAACDDRHLPAVLRVFTQTALEIDEGQQYDMDFERRQDVREEEYIEMIRLKTSVLLACALKIGAILADAPQEDADTLYAFGEKVGLAFQLQDDYLDVYGDPAVFGKKIGGDILCNKKTYMLIQALTHADDRQRDLLQFWLNAVGPVPEKKIAAVRALYDEIGIPAMAKAKIEGYFAEADNLLASLHVEESQKQVLHDYTRHLLARQS